MTLSLSTCSWCVVSAYTWLALWLSLLSTCSWCVVSAYTWLALWLSLLSTCSWCVVSAYTWLSLCLSLLSTCSWCVVSAYTWLALWLSLLSTCSWCVVRAYLYFILWQRKPLNCDKITKPSVGYCFSLSRVYMYLNIHTTTVNVLGKINRIVYPKMKIMISVIHPLVVSTLNDCLSSVENRGGKMTFWEVSEFLCFSFCPFNESQYGFNVFWFPVFFKISSLYYTEERKPYRLSKTRGWVNENLSNCTLTHRYTVHSHVCVTHIQNKHTPYKQT